MVYIFRKDIFGGRSVNGVRANTVMMTNFSLRYVCSKSGYVEGKAREDLIRAFVTHREYVKLNLIPPRENP